MVLLWKQKNSYNPCIIENILCRDFFLLFIQVLQLMFEFVDKGVVENIYIQIEKKYFFRFEKTIFI